MMGGQDRRILDFPFYNLSIVSILIACSWQVAQSCTYVRKLAWFRHTERVRYPFT